MPFSVPNELDAGFADQAELDSRDLAILAGGIAGTAGSGYGTGQTGVQAGCAVTAQGSPDMTVAVAAGVARIGGRRVTVAGGNVTITAGHGTLARFDLITVDTSGTKAAVAGTAAANASFPAISAGTVVLAAVYVPAADTAINTNQITDKRVSVDKPASDRVEWYGALVDGATDDATAIQAALTAAGIAGGIVDIGPGVCLVNTAVTIPSNVTLAGAGMDLTTIKANANNITPVVIATSASNVTIRDITLNDNRATFPTGTGNACYCAGGATNLFLFNTKFTNGQTFSIALDTVSGAYNRVRAIGCIFEDSGQGWDTFGSGGLNDVTISACVFRNSTGQGFATFNSTGGIVITGCSFQGPLGNGVSLEPASDVLISGNTFNNLSTGTVGIFARPAPGTVADPSNITIVGNSITNVGTVSTFLTSQGIVLRNTTQATIVGNTIKRMSREGILLQAQTVTSSANTTQYVTIHGNAVTDCNQDSAGGIGAIGIARTAGTMTDINVVGNSLIKINADSQTTHGILEAGTMTNNVYVGNNIRGHLTAAIGITATTTDFIGFNSTGDSLSVASATTTTLPPHSDYFNITGTTTITSVAASWPGRFVTLKFAGILTFTDGSNLKLVGNMTTAANSTISLVSDGTNWYETSRTAPG